MFALCSNVNITEAEKVANETEKREEDFNQRLESFLFESEKFNRHSLLSIGEGEGKAIIIIAAIHSIALLLTVIALFLKVIYMASSKARASQNGR